MALVDKSHEIRKSVGYLPETPPLYPEMSVREFVRFSGKLRRMDKETLDRIFDTFYTTRKEGMGLGLSISRTIIEAHGGQLTAHSAPGTGSTFFFTLNRTPT